MRAFRLLEDGSAALVDVPVPEPGPGEVLVEVAGAGLCHSDLHLMHYGGGLYPPPFTLGHETAGVVAARGPGVTGIDEGIPVVVHGPWGCGRCAACRRGSERLCTFSADRAGSGLGRDGGLAEYLLVPSPRYLVELGDLDPVTAGPLDDAALTPYHAIMTTRSLLAPGEQALVIGVGGLGHAAVQLLRVLTPARVVAIDTSARQRALAADSGADLVLDPAEDPIGQLAGPGRGCAVVFDCVGSDETLALAAAVVRPGGRIVVIGAALGTLPYTFITLPYDATIGTTFWGDVDELAQVVALAQQGRLTLHTERVPLDEVAAAYQRLETGTVGGGRLVAVP